MVNKLNIKLLKFVLRFLPNFLNIFYVHLVKLINISGWTNSKHRRIFIFDSYSRQIKNGKIDLNEKSSPIKKWKKFCVPLFYINLIKKMLHIKTVNWYLYS